MDFPPHSNPICAIKLSKLFETHVLTSITCCKCRIPFPPRSKFKWTTNSFYPTKHANGTLMSKTLNKSSLQCVTIIPLISPLNSKIMWKLTTCVTLVNFLKVQNWTCKSMQCVENWIYLLFLKKMFQTVYCKCVISLIQDLLGNIFKPIGMLYNAV